MSQAIRHQFLIFAGAPLGGVAPITTPYTTAAGLLSSEAVVCNGLERKTVEITATAAEIAANPIIIEGTISEDAPDKAAWFPVTAAIAAPGIFTILIAAPIFYEPELSRIRITQAPNTNALPPSLRAVFQGFWHGDGLWCERVKNNVNGYLGV